MTKAKKEKLSLEELLEQALVKEEDRPYEVPGNWVWTRLDNIVSICTGKRDANYGTEDGKYYFFTCAAEPIRCDGYSFEGESILLAGNGANVGLALYYNGKFEAYQRTYVIQSKCEINLKYIFYHFKGFWKEYNADKQYGSATNYIKLGNFQDYPIPLPPVAEQQRIVEVIEPLFEKLDTAKELVQNALDSFENRKAAILYKAFTGELTARWREENKTNYNILLDDICEYYIESNVKKNFEKIFEFQALVQEIKSIKNSIWYKCSIGAVSVVSNGSTPSRQNLDFWNGNIHWISSGEVRNNIIKMSKETISQAGYDSSSVKMLPAGTVLIAMIGEGKTRGQSAILNISATINQNIAAIDVSHKKVESKFMWYWLQKQYENNRQKGNGTGPQALNCQRVRELDFVLPPLAEQQEIVRILDNLLSNEQRAKELSDVIERIDIMKKAILARAFRGELGTNDAEEESAVELLKEVLREKMI